MPIICGKYQANIPEAYPTTSFENGVFSVDFRVAYDIPELKKLIREYSFSDTGVRVCDNFDIEGECTFTERLVSYVEPKIDGGVIDYGKAIVKFNPELASARVEKDIHSIELDTDGNLKRGIDVYLVSIDVKNPKDSFDFFIETK